MPGDSDGFDMFSGLDFGGGNGGGYTGGGEYGGGAAVPGSTNPTDPWWLKTNPLFSNGYNAAPGQWAMDGQQWMNQYSTGDSGGEIGWDTYHPTLAFADNIPWLKSFGYDISDEDARAAPMAGGGGDGVQDAEDRTHSSQVAEDFKTFMGNKGLSLGGVYDGGEGAGGFAKGSIPTFYTGAFDKSGNRVGGLASTRDRGDDGDWAFALALAAASAGAGGLAGGYLAAEAGATGTLATGAATGAGAGFASAASQSGDFGQAFKGAAVGAATGAAGSGLNTAGYLGVDDPTYAKMINGAVGGGIKAGATGGNVGFGALSGGATAGAGSMWDSFANSLGGGGAPIDWSGGDGGYSSVPTDPDSYQAWKQNNFQQSYAPTPYSSGSVGDSLSGAMNGMSTRGITSYGGGGGQDNSEGYSMPYAALSPSAAGGTDPYAGMAQTGSGGDWADYLKKNGGNIAGALGSLYMGRQQANQAGKMRSQLDALYSPNSPYALQARSAIQRADAAAGRRSQVGARETNLAAQLTQMRNGQLMSPAYQGLQGQQQGGYAQMLGPLLQLYNRGAFNGLGSAIGSAGSAIGNYFTGG